MLGAGPPKTGGIPTFIHLLKEYAKSDESLLLHHINSAAPDRKRHLAKRLLCSLKIALILIANMAKNYEVVYLLASGIHSLFEKSFFALICKLMGKRTVVHIRAGDVPALYERSSRWLKQLISKLIELPDIVVVLSSGWASYYRKISKQINIQVVENGTNPLNKIPLRNPSKKTTDVLFLGHINEAKGLLVILEAIRKINRTKANIFFHLVGGEEYEGDFDRIKEVFEKSGFKNFYFYGHKNGKEKNEFLEKSDIFILPSYSEGFPNALLEAMSFGLPVVATRVGAIPEVIEHGKNGYLINPGDFESLSNAILTLSRSREKRLRFGENNYKKVKEHYNFEETYRKLKKIFIESKRI